VQREEVKALGELAGSAAAGLAGQVREIHEGISQRVFRLVPGAGMVRTIHDGVSSGAHSASRALTGGIVRSGAGALSSRLPEGVPIDSSLAGRLAVGALNGMFGDALHRDESVLTLKMSLRRGGTDVALDGRSLAAAFPDATPRLAVFLHGLCETDDAWKLGAARHTPYGTRLQVEHGYTPLYIRYNSGLHVSENGRALAQLLRDVVNSWPVEIGEIALIGHSMGGLLARSACYYDADAGWTDRVRHVFMLGTPHRGARLERAANRLGSALSRLPETRGFAAPLRIRSAGIKDLFHGYLTDEDWFGSDPDVYLRNAAREIPFLPTANHYFVCATLSREADAPLGRMIGDLLVLRASAWGQRRGERLRFPVDHYRHVGGANHFELLNHPAIYQQIEGWLVRGRELSSAACA
jgi:pimeloyl-ACP methyl ester carboxylesterase